MAGARRRLGDQKILASLFLWRCGRMGDSLRRDGVLEGRMGEGSERRGRRGGWRRGGGAGGLAVAAIVHARGVNGHGQASWLTLS